MPKRTGKRDQVLLKLDDEIKPKFQMLRQYYGARANTDLVRVLINDKYNEIKGDQKTESLPRFEQINFDENGVKVLDRDLHEVVQVYLKPEGIFCAVCEKTDCEHITFALSLDQIKKEIKKKRREGWKLPEVG